jgi:hypothetical protein
MTGSESSLPGIVQCSVAGGRNQKIIIPVQNTYTVLIVMLRLRMTHPHRWPHAGEEKLCAEPLR